MSARDSRAGIGRLLGVGVWSWIWWQRWRLRRRGRVLGASERAALGEHFGREALDRVRVVEKAMGLGPVLSGVARRVGLGGIVARVRGMALVDVIVVAPGACDASLLFHEMVHVVQYRVHGVWGFSCLYARGLVRGGYLGIGLESEAYALQRRFESGEVFDVDREVRRGAV